VNREAELPAPTGVGSGDLLGHWLILSSMIWQRTCAHTHEYRGNVDEN